MAALDAAYGAMGEDAGNLLEWSVITRQVFAEPRARPMVRHTEWHQTQGLCEDRQAIALLLGNYVGDSSAGSSGLSTQSTQHSTQVDRPMALARMQSAIEALAWHILRLRLVT